MNDRHILKTLENIKEYCTKHKFCEGCKFHLSGGACQIYLVLETLEHSAPFLWELDKIEIELNK